MPHEPQKFLHDLLDSARFLVGYTADRKYEDYLGDRGFRSAVERELITIGEAVLRLHKFDATLCARISEYQRIISFRNILVHGYLEIDHGRLFDEIGWIEDAAEFAALIEGWLEGLSSE